MLDEGMECGVILRLCARSRIYAARIFAGGISVFGCPLVQISKRGFSCAAYLL